MSKKFVGGWMPALGVLMFGLLSPSADAVPSRTFPGVNCERTSGGTLARLGGMIQNSSTSSALNVICPIVRDRIGTKPGIAAYQAFDRNSSADVSCTLCSDWTISGTSLISDCRTAATTGSGTAAQNIGLVVPNEGSSTYGHWYMTCSIPPRANGVNSSLVSFRVEEE